MIAMVLLAALPAVTFFGMTLIDSWFEHKEKMESYKCHCKGHKHEED